MSRLVGTGAVMVDIVLGVPHLPPQGGDVVAMSHRTTVGGGLNVLAAARRDGLPGVFAGRTGTGPFADLVGAALREEGLEAWLPPVPDLDNGFCVVLVDETAERTFVTSPGAEEQVTAADLDRLVVAPDDAVHVSGYALASRTRSGPLAAWVSALPAGPTVVLDASPLVGQVASGVLRAVLDRVDLLTCNAREAAVLAPGDDDEPATTASALRALLAPHALVVVRDGEHGTWAAGPDRSAPWHVPAHQVVAVDTTGAGDAHTGVLVAALARGWSVPDAVQRANVAAALAVTQHGPATAPAGAELDVALELYRERLR